MADITLDQALTVVRNLAERKANAFVRRCGFAIDEREDLQSHLVLIFITRWPKFDGEKASVQTFASRLMDRELTSIVRYRHAQCRQPREVPILGANLAAASLYQFRVDLERAMAPLPKILRQTATALSWCSAVDAAAELDCSRQMIGRRKHQIRDALVDGGVTSNYFAPGSVRQ